ncbi:unnamed protein product, partial [marine sediment metagenome]
MLNGYSFYGIGGIIAPDILYQVLCEISVKPWPYFVKGRDINETVPITPKDILLGSEYSKHA